jgi:hypothetical protein
VATMNNAQFLAGQQMYFSGSFDAELCNNHVTPPKAIDNAIVNYVRIVSGDPTLMPH